LPISKLRWTFANKAAFHDLKSRLAERLVEAGKDVAVVTFGADFVFPALGQNVSLEQGIDASNYLGDTRRRSNSPASRRGLRPASG
jgi:hypothetical protein